MADAATPLVLPQLGPLYQALAPWAEALLRFVVGFALIPHGLRNTFGLWPGTGIRAHNLTELGAQLDRDGYRPGKFWGCAPVWRRCRSCCFSSCRISSAGGSAAISGTRPGSNTR